VNCSMTPGSWDILTIWKQIQSDLESPVNAYLRE
jgi:hypothetical protein